MIGGNFDKLVRGTPEFIAAALRGVVPGVRRVVFTGYNSDVDVATAPEDIFPAIESTIIPRVTVAESWEIVSSSVDDAAAGTGGRTVLITTLSSAYGEVTQTVTLNGTTAVALTGTHIAANAGLVTTVGSGGTNAGLLTIRVAGGGAARAYISATDGVLNQCKYTVPANRTLELYSAVMGLTTGIGGGAEGARFLFVVGNSAGRALNTVRLPLFASGTSLYRHEVGSGLIPYNTAAAMTELSIRVSSVTQNNTMVEAAVIGLLYDSTIWP